MNKKAIGLASVAIVAALGFGGFRFYENARLAKEAVASEGACRAGELAACETLCGDLAGPAWACIEQGKLLTLRDPVGKDAETAYGIFERLCEKGVGEGCSRAVRAVINGRGVARDVEKAVAFFQISCELSN